MQHRLLRSTLLVLLLAGGAVAAEQRPARWKWSMLHQGDDVRLECSSGAKIGYSFTIGAGGGISAIDDLDSKPQSLLAPTFKGEHTDRIVQWTAWCDDIVSDIKTAAPSAGRFNITQGGDVEGSFATIVDVVPDEKNHRLDVFAVPQEQWKVEQQKEIHCRLSCLTRYDLLPEGVLKISRFIRIGKVTLHGKPTRFNRLYVEGWTPFLRSPKAFDAVATGLDGNGVPTRSYATGKAFPYYPNIDATASAGYAVAFNDKHPKGTALGVVFGSKPPTPAGKQNQCLLNLMEWDDGVAILPGVVFHDVEQGSIVEQTIYLLARPGLSKEMRDLLTATAASASPPTLHAPAALAAGDLRQIDARLNANTEKPGQKTEHLYPLVRQQDKTLPGN